MLKFWKKTGRNIINNNESVEKLNVETTRQVFDPIIPFTQLEDLDENHSDYVVEEKESLICRTLEDTLRNKDALNYFIEFMKIRDAFSYILCYLDIEAYKAEIIPEEKCSTLVNKFDHHHDNIYYETHSADNNCDNFYNTTISSSELINLEDHEDQFVKTALEIFKKYIALEAKFTINCSEILRKEIMENICDSVKVLNGTCFKTVTNYLMDLMKNEYFNAYLDTDFFYKHQIDILTSDNVVLDDILYNETALFYFMEFLEQENKRNLLEFWLAATNLQQQLKDQKEFFDPIEAQNDAIVLYDKYFSLQAHCPLGFSDKVRFRLEQNICGENGLVINSFNIPLKIVEKYMEKNYLKSFLTCQLFYKYLSELINSVQENGYNTSSSIEQKKLNSPLSDCSSEKSFSAASNTFLVLEVTTTTKSNEKKKNMSIDTRELYDPDRLWRRKKPQRLSLGRVTKLGQYVADIEPDPDKKTFKLKDVVKKMISLEEEEKRREEMAWKVAEMIVKDITSITLQDAQY